MKVTFPQMFHIVVYVVPDLTWNPFIDFFRNVAVRRTKTGIQKKGGKLELESNKVGLKVSQSNLQE